MTGLMCYGLQVLDELCCFLGSYGDQFLLGKIKSLYEKYLEDNLKAHDRKRREGNAIGKIRKNQARKHPTKVLISHVTAVSSTKTM